VCEELCFTFHSHVCLYSGMICIQLCDIVTLTLCIIVFTTGVNKFYCTNIYGLPCCTYSVVSTYRLEAYHYLAYGPQNVNCEQKKTWQYNCDHNSGKNILDFILFQTVCKHYASDILSLISKYLYKRIISHLHKKHSQTLKITEWKSLIKH